MIAGGEAAASMLMADGRVLEFVKDQYRHCKTIFITAVAKHRHFARESDPPRV